MNDVIRPASASARDEMLKPILVLGSGRSGSTALMSLLGGSPLIAFDKRYPYESSYLSYLSLTATIVGGPHPRGTDPGWNRETLVSGKSRVIGAIPFRTEGYLSRERLAGEAFTGLWSAFSKTVTRKALKQGLERPTHYAEKGGFFLADFLAGRLDTRELYLLRDPRDIMMSSKSFNRKRRTLRFGWRADDTDASYAGRFVKRVRKRIEAALKVTPDHPRKRIVRYEDLVLQPERTARRLSEFLGVDLGIDNALPAHEAHKTTADPAASVGRWRRDMDEEVQALFEEELGDLLDRAGYARRSRTDVTAG